MSQQDEFRIYVADLAEYNAGRLHGEWLTPTDYADVEDLQAAVTALMAHPDHEYAIHDSEGVRIAEHTSLATIMHIARAVEEHGVEKVNAYLEEGRSSDLSTLASDISDADMGEYSSKEAWAEEQIDSAYDLNKLLGNLANYFDYAAYARDAQLGGDVTFVSLENGNVWVLSNH